MLKRELMLVVPRELMLKRELMLVVPRELMLKPQKRRKCVSAFMKEKWQAPRLSIQRMHVIRREVLKCQLCDIVAISPPI